MCKVAPILFSMIFFICAPTCNGQTGSSSSGSSSLGIPDEILNKLIWLSAKESPFDIPVFDTRAFATTMLSVTKDKNVAARYTELTKADGRQFIGKNPAYSRIANYSFSVAGAKPLQNGPVFVSGAMEEKWNIYFFENTLYFVRSWTGSLIYCAEVKIAEKLLVVKRVDYDGRIVKTDFDAARAVDFLIKSHIFRTQAVAPIPNDISNDKAEIAMYLFGLYGRLAYFGSKENTIAAKPKK